VDKPLKSVTHGHCDARPTVTSPATGHHRPLTGTKLYTVLLGDRGTCVWITCPRLLPESWTAEIQTRDLLSRESNALTTTPPGHTHSSRHIILSSDCRHASHGWSTNPSLISWADQRRVTNRHTHAYWRRWPTAWHDTVAAWCRMRLLTAPLFKCWSLKIQYGGRPPFWKTVKPWYLCSRLTDFFYIKSSKETRTGPVFTQFCFKSFWN